VDLILCRDCLVHLPLADAVNAVDNLRRSGSQYLLTTTFVNRDDNRDIPAAGGWRPLNLRRPPFNFPDPLLVLDERCTAGDGKYADKSLGLWLLASLPGPGSGADRSG
jgi:hypothetical protein